MIVFEPLQPAPRLPVGSGHALQPGDTLEDFEITQVLGLTSFGVIYLARSLSQQRTVALKEYLPVAIAARGADNRIELRDPTHEEAFQRGLQSFIGEALTLSQFEHPSLLRVTSVWEGHGTAYRAMPHYVGNSLLARRFSSKLPPNAAQLQTMLDGLLGALDQLHGCGFAHGQIEPMNILVLDDGRPVLLDFDAARHAILSDIHAPHVDAYSNPVTLAANQSADLHALAAVMHFAISGQWSPLPAGATRRHEPLSAALSRMKDGAASLGYDPVFLAAIDAALAPDAQLHSVAEFRQLFKPAPTLKEADLAETQPLDLPTRPLPLPPESPAVATVAVVMPAPADVRPAAAPVDVPLDAPVPPDAMAPHGDLPPPVASIAAPAAAVHRPKRPPPRPIPDRAVREYPLNSSESVLELLAAFGRPQQPQSDDFEPFQSPAVPTLTEEAEPALPPLRESPFDTLDNQGAEANIPAAGTRHAALAPHGAHAPANSPRPRSALLWIAGLGIFVAVAAALWLLKSR